MSDNPIISIRNITKRFGNFTALDDISIDIEPGEFFALLGPSGCGKSTLLRIIAGIEMPTEGDLLIDGKDMTNTPPNKRPVNMVFQSYAVFPHMSVTKNVAYGLQLQGMAKSEIDALVDKALAQVHLSDFKERMPDQLSGGQRQRVALARALVKRPRVLLLDEPLSALDAKLRDAMRLELVKLQESVGVSFIMVTHDQSEALAMADRVAVLDEGRLRQLASPAELYQNPCDAFVADFIGNINMFDITSAEAGDDNVVFATDELGRMAFPADTLTRCGGNAGGHLLAIRPEKVKVDLAVPQTGGPSAKGQLGDVAFQGKSSIIEVILEGGRSITAYVHDSDAAALLDAETGSDIWCSWDTADMLLLPKSV